MKRKYYLRGIGIAMIVTSLLVGFSHHNEVKELSDEQIIARAKELGMIENEFLDTASSSDKDDNLLEESKETEVLEETDLPEETEVPQETEAPEETEAPQETEAPEDSVEIEEPTTSELIMFEVKRGDSSDVVSKRLEEAGLVIDAKEFDQYLCSQGYDKRIAVGIFEIPVDSTEEEIGQIITRKKKK